MVPWGKKRSGQPLIVSNLIILSSANVPQRVLFPTSCPLWCPSSVPMSLSVSSCPLLLDELRLTITMVVREHMESKEMLANLVWWEWEHCPSIH